MGDMGFLYRVSVLGMELPGIGEREVGRGDNYMYVVREHYYTICPPPPPPQKKKKKKKKYIYIYIYTIGISATITLKIVDQS